MRFQLTESQRGLRDEVRAFVRDEIEPVASDLDQTETYPEDILDELGEMGITGLTLPEELGGRGEGLVELVIATEELAAAQMALASAVALNLGVATVIERFGTDEQREQYVPEMARFETVGALGLSEADAGSDKLAMETTADREGDEWVLNGHKQWVTNFPHADVVLTYAKTGPESASPHNVSAFLVPTAEFEVDRDWETLGARSVSSPRVTLSDVRVPDDAMVGDEGEAYVQRGTVHTGVNVPARAVGIARAALEDTVAYTAEREQFDRAIGDFQGVRWRLGEMADRVESSRLLTLRAADRADRGRSVDRAFAMAKVHATEAAVENANEAMRLHGGVGYTREHDVERYLRDARLLTIAGGPNEGHRDALADAVVDDYGTENAE
ncbi:acyl-CoA dehydrogenase family protein [Halorientalis halophila]|uniref:acyl-CoA dehydrogenase family protein n=1 Tax=Halorientalis halophila TaxID=3108499 RepID=UPI0030097CC0